MLGTGCVSLFQPAPHHSTIAGIYYCWYEVGTLAVKIDLAFVRIFFVRFGRN